MLNKIWQYLGQDSPAEKVALFRIGFAFALFLQAFLFYRNDFIQQDVLDPVLHFSYPGFSFISVLDPPIMYALLILLFISALSLMLGYRSRLSAAIYLLSFGYLFLLDKGYYNNHYYLELLLLTLLCFIPSDAALSISGKKRSLYKWQVFLLLFQFSLVLIYAGFNKLNYYWLVEHEPIRHILQAKAVSSQLDLWNSVLLENVLVWGGLFFDLFIVPLLLWKRTRLLAIALFIIFNTLNSILFYDIGEIGVFPLVMLSSLILFVPDKNIAKLMKRFFDHSSAPLSDEKLSYSFSPLAKGMITTYVVLQVLIPLRHHLYKGNVDYTGEGQRFAWRMKSVYKDFSISLILEDKERGISAALDPRTVLTMKQFTNLGYYPELLLPLSENLRQTAREKGIDKAMIYADYQVAFMGHPMQYIVDPNRELGELKYSPFRHSDWILPLKED
jgi:hypothetical protein